MWQTVWQWPRFWEEPAMFQKILIPVDLADPEFVKPALATGVELARASSGAVRLINVIPMTPVMLAEYVPPDFDVQQRGSAEEALAIIAKESGLPADKVSAVVRQGGIYHEVLEEAKAFGCDIIVMSSHRPAMKTYFLGSNAGHMVRYAKCSVLVVRRPAKEHVFGKDHAQNKKLERDSDSPRNDSALAFRQHRRRHRIRVEGPRAVAVEERAGLPQEQRQKPRDERAPAPGLDLQGAHHERGKRQ